MSPFTRKSAPMIVGMPALPEPLPCSRAPALLPLRNVACGLQEFGGIKVLPVVQDLVMYMRTGAPASGPDQANHVTGRHALTGFNVNPRHVPVPGDDAVTVVNLHHIAEFAIPTGGNDNAGS